MPLRLTMGVFERVAGSGVKAELRIAAGLDRTSREIVRMQGAKQALFAVVDTLVKTFLASAGQAMVGGSQAAMNDLVNRADY